MATPRKVALHTLGCKLNYSESSQLGRQFMDKGYSLVKFTEEADVYVINTCSVTDFADRKCRKAIRDARRSNQDGMVIVTGCYAQLKPEEISKIDGVNLVLGAAEKWKMLDYVDEYAHTGLSGMVHCGNIADHQEFSGSYSVKDRTRTFLKVQDGCDYKCSFCTIPLARGKSRSMKPEEVLTQISFLENESTVQEIVLTGINLGDYGLIHDGEKTTRQHSFCDLVKMIDESSGIPRFRISSIEPNLCDDDIIEYVASAKRFMPHFHMPLQSGSDTLLKSMRRRYKSGLYAERVGKIKSLMPHACIGVDVIVGYPGESEEYFLETCQFLDKLDISYLHVFTYSERANTHADGLGDVVPMNVRRERNAILRELSTKKRRSFYQQHLGTERAILAENKRNGDMLEAYTDNYIRVKISHEAVRPNQILQVRLEEIDTDGVVIGSMI